MDWRLAEAKNRLSEVVRLALSEGPQRISRRDDAVIVVAEQAYRDLAGEEPDFIAYLMSGESLEDVDLRRDRTPLRDVAL